ncbi:MAG: hypothetical protein AAF564_26280, partial [Bacteroidota bacterium]
CHHPFDALGREFPSSPCQICHRQCRTVILLRFPPPYPTNQAAPSVVRQYAFVRLIAHWTV